MGTPHYSLEWVLRKENAIEILEKFVKALKDSKESCWEGTPEEARKLGYALGRLLGNRVLELEILNGIMQFSEDYYKR